MANELLLAHLKALQAKQMLVPERDSGALQRLANLGTMITRLERSHSSDGQKERSNN